MLTGTLSQHSPGFVFAESVVVAVHNVGLFLVAAMWRYGDTRVQKQSKQIYLVGEAIRRRAGTGRGWRSWHCSFRFDEASHPGPKELTQNVPWSR